MSAPVALTEFLLARIAEDEAGARAATPGPWYWEPPSGEDWPQSDESLLSSHRGESDDYDPSVLNGWGYDASGIHARDEDRAHIARHDPARVLAECEAKRTIVDLAYLADEEGAEPIYLRALRALAAVHAGHPDYCGEWRP